MDDFDIKDPIFKNAVQAIDNGDSEALRNILEKDPSLVSKRLDSPDEGYFMHPYLLWFVADNPIRHEKCPPNICDITRLLIDKVKQNAAQTYQHQVDYTLALVATGRIPRESGVQNEWMDILMDAGAKPGNVVGALAHGNVEAARHLLQRGAELTLTAAICLDMYDEIHQLEKTATKSEKQIALMAAAFYGKAEMIKLLLDTGVNVNDYIDRSSGFHSHATALHQAVFSGSLESVKLLIEAGADLGSVDRIYEGTPLGWAKYMQTVENDPDKRSQYAIVEKFLETKVK